MGKKGHSDPNLFGGYTHYDEKGRKVGRSEKNLFGGYTHYDSEGHKIGESNQNLFGGYTTKDTKGHKVGNSEPNLFGGYSHYDSRGKKRGESSPNMYGGYSHQDGCYIATCVYGSYDCPEVRVLRRYRDEKLALTAPGRWFIRCYYALSPTAVRVLGDSAFIRNIWRKMLDRKIRSLRRQGVSDGPISE